MDQTAIVMKLGANVMYHVHVELLKFTSEVWCHFIYGSHTLVGFTPVGYENILNDIESADYSGN